MYTPSTISTKTASSPLGNREACEMMGYHHKCSEASTESGQLLTALTAHAQSAKV